MVGRHQGECILGRQVYDFVRNDSNLADSSLGELQELENSLLGMPLMGFPLVSFGPRPDWMCLLGIYHWPCVRVSDPLRRLQ